MSLLSKTEKGLKPLGVHPGYIMILLITIWENWDEGGIPV